MDNKNMNVIEELEEILPRMMDDASIDDLLKIQELTVSDPAKASAHAGTQDICVRSIEPRNYNEYEFKSDFDISDNPDGKKPSELHKAHRAKLRKRYIEEGFENFQKHNVLEMLLFYALPRVDTNEIAHRLLNRYHGNISEVLGADVKSLMKVGGVGENAAVLLSMIPQVFRMYREELMERKGIFGRSDIEQYIANRFTSEPVERVLIACLDNRWNLLGDEFVCVEGVKKLDCEFVSTGSVNFSSVDRRAILEVCLRYNATAAIIAHNHPRGSALPSRDDLNTTVEVRRALDVIGVRLIDHLIVAREDYVSLSCSRNYGSLFT